MVLRVDLHIHTVYSGDSTIDPKHIVNQLHAHPFIKGVAVTDHNTLEGYVQVSKLASVYKDLVILPGIEITTDKGDIVVLGVEENPWPSNQPIITLEVAVEYAKAADATIVIPHPYRSMGIGDYAQNIDAHAIEVSNPTATAKENLLAQKLAKARNLPGVAGTDAHTPTEMWTAFTEIWTQPTVEDVLKAVRKGLVRARRPTVVQTGRNS